MRLRQPRAFSGLLIINYFHQVEGSIAGRSSRAPTLIQHKELTEAMLGALSPQDEAKRRSIHRDAGGPDRPCVLLDFTDDEAPQ